MIHVLISGAVQRVGFRQFIKSNANRLSIKGWVKNLPDRRVEAMLAGNEDSLGKMVDLCKKGPFLAEVKNIEIEKLPDEEFESFEIIT